MNRILDERDKQTIEGNINSITAVINQHIENLEDDVQTLDSQKANQTTLNSHTNNKSNPHQVTCTQIGADPTGSANKALNDAKAYTDTKVAALVDSSPAALDTLNELAAALNDDANFASTVTTALGTKTNNTEFTAHTSNVSNPHSVTKAQVGLSNVPNVTTNNQAPTFTAATTLATLTSGETLSTSLGKIMKAITDFINHLANKSNPHSVTKAQVGLGNADNTSDVNKPVSTAQATAINSVQTNLDAHIGKTDNPHQVTKAQVGLGSVDNTSDTDKPVSTAQATAIDDAKKTGTNAQSAINSHIKDKQNPHGVTIAQIGADAAGAADTALSSAKSYTDTKVSELGALAAKDIIEQSDLSTEIQTSLGLANTSLQSYEEVDPTVPAWAKQASKPTYTASEVGALPDSTIALKNPNSLTFTGAIEAAYDGSEELTVNIPKLPIITEEDEGKVLCVVNGTYTLVAISDLLPGETDTPETPVEPDVPENPENPTPEEPEV